MPETTHLRYPYKEYGDGSNRDRLDDYLYIRVLEYLPPGFQFDSGSDLNTFIAPTAEFRRRRKDIGDIDSGGKVNQLATIILPIPDKVQDNNGADWTSGNMNPLAAVIAGGSLAAVQSSNLFGKVMGDAADTFNKLETAIQSDKKATAAGTTGLIANALFGQLGINQVTSRGSGQVFNQNTEFLFNGVQIRPAFQFTFDLTPRSKEESNAIKRIIRTFKYHMAPKASAAGSSGEGARSSLFVKSPDVFQLQYKMGKNNHPFLHKFKLCALTQMSVDYTGSGQHSTYADGTPVHMKLSLQFQELSPIFAEDQYEYFEGKVDGDGNELGVGY